jgi:ureidoglycolate lyase
LVPATSQFGKSTMTVTDVPSISVEAEPLAPGSFARFGDVVARPTAARRHYLPTSLDCADDAGAISLWISGAAAVKSLPLRLTVLERHPFSAQTFIPLDAGRYLVIVCGADPQGGPDLTTLRAFLAGAHQSVTFARNVWHHPMTVLEKPIEFAVAMGMTGRGDDDIFQDLDTDVTVVMPQAAP